MSENYDYGLIRTGRRERGVPPARAAAISKVRVGGMKCPSCGSLGTVTIDTRTQVSYENRRRACVICGTRFVTREYIEDISLRLPNPISTEKASFIIAEWRQNVDKVIAGTMM